ncbi:ABC transporter permease [Rhizobium paranaense]|uniref:Putative spermidine/putrescine transport system permease protein n=1 Tax=Rhizobium paranaense TaxID=1650438 RepID=A0A7W8XXI1_9HYPH|nr:putative spermidine/putrescine transport system permease protein [Rhizobium paranaense]
MIIAKPLFGALMMAFLLAPLAAILPLAFTSSVFLAYPIPGYSMRWFEELLTVDVWRMSIVNSLLIGAGTTLLAGALGTSAALGLRKGGLLFADLFRTVFLLPMVVPAVVLGVGMQLMFVRIGLANTYVGVICAHTVVAVPFVIVTVSASLAGIDRRIEQAAASLGAPAITVFRRVTFPLALPGILSGAVFAFATSLDEVVLTLFVAGPNQRTLARQTFSTIRENVSPAIAAAAFLFIIGTVVIVGVGLAMLLRSRSNHTS